MLSTSGWTGTIRMAMDALAVRMEWNGRGPIWCEETFRLLNRLSKQATRGFRCDGVQDTFLEHYVANAASPYENPLFDWHLSRLEDGNERMVFGFADGGAMGRNLGLRDPKYRRQFEALLERKEFAVRVFLVRALASSDEEVLFVRREAQLLEELRCVEAVCGV